MFKDRSSGPRGACLSKASVWTKLFHILFVEPIEGLAHRESCAKFEASAIQPILYVSCNDDIPSSKTSNESNSSHP